MAKQSIAAPLVLVCLVAGVAAMAMATMWSVIGEQHAQYVQQITTVGDDEVAVLRSFRPEGNQLELSWMNLDGEIAWSHTLSGHCQRNCWVIRRGDVAVIQSSARTTRSWTIHQASDGKLLWDGKDHEVLRNARKSTYSWIADGGDPDSSLWVYGEGIGDAHLALLSNADGSVIWTKDIIQKGLPPRLRIVDDRVLVMQEKSIKVFDLHEGNYLATARGSSACLAGENLLYQRADLLWRLDLRSLKESPLQVALESAEQTPLTMLGDCGLYDNNTLMTFNRRIEVKQGDIRDVLDMSVIVAMKTGEWNPAWVLDLRRDEFFPFTRLVADRSDGWRSQSPRWRRFEGELTRYVPLQLTGPGVHNLTRLAVIDLQEAEVKWVGNPAVDLENLHWMRYQNYYLLSGVINRGGTGVLAVLDGTTGTFVSSVTIPNPAWTEWTPSQIGKNWVWIGSDTHWGRVALPTLKPVGDPVQLPSITTNPPDFSQILGLPDGAYTPEN